MGYVPPAVAPGAPDFAALKRGGLDAVIASVFAENSISVSDQAAIRRLLSGGAAGYASGSINGFLGGNPVPVAAVLDQLATAHRAALVLAQAIHEAAALVDANPGTIGVVDIGLDRAPGLKRSWN